MSDKEKKEYLVQVTITEARHITPKDDSGMANPFVKMKVADAFNQTTEVNYQTLTPVWNQSFTFSGLNLSLDELQSSELSFELWSKNNYLGNDLIGIYSVGLHTLYRNANHEFFCCWLTLTSPDEPTEAQGYLLVNCFIVGPGDKPPFHSINDNVNNDMEEEDEEINVDAMTFEQLQAYQEKKEGIQILGKPSIARKTFQLSVYVFKAEHLVDFPSTIGYDKCSAFISARSVGLVSKTKMIKKNNGPSYNQKMLFPCYYPFLNDKILMRIWNYGYNSADDFIANIPEHPSPSDFFNITKLISMGGRMPAKWINLYGIPPWERNTSFTNIKHPKEGTAYLGRVLISFSLLANEKPVYTVMPCNPFYDPDSLPYVLYCDIYKLYFLKNYDVVVWCDVTIGNFSVKNFKTKVKSNNTAEWLKEEDRNKIMLPGIVEHHPKDTAQIPDIFINLYTGINDSKIPTRIGYIRLKPEEVMKWQPEPRWLHFKSLDMKEDSPGSVLVNLQFKLDSDMTRRVFREKSGMEKKYTLYTHIVSGFELDPKNKDTDDDYHVQVIVKLDGEEKKTDVKTSRYPFWNNILPIEKKLDMNLDFAPDILVSVIRTNRKGYFGMSLSDELLLGAFSVPIRCCKDGVSYPHYFNLIRNNEKNGRLLANFYIEQNTSGIKKDQTPAYKNFMKVNSYLGKQSNTNIEVAILGLRDFDFTLIPAHISTKLEVSITGCEEKKKPKNELKLIHNVDERKETFLNVFEIFKFENIKIYGTSEFMIFPILTIKLNYSNFFLMEEERFIISSLKEFYSSQMHSVDSNNKMKMYRLIWEQNLDCKRIDQELVDLFPDPTKKKKKIVDDDDDDDDEEEEKEEIILKKNEEENKRKVDPSKNVTDLLLQEKEKEKDKNSEKLEKKVVNIDKLLEQIRKYKNMEISNLIYLVCTKSDKDSEKAAKKVLRKVLKKEKKLLDKKELAEDEDVAQLIKLERKIRDLSKPLMNEGIFYGFDDLSDDYDYGREVFKEDIYEFHSNMSFNYIRDNLYYIPWALFSEIKAEDMGGYLKYGKKCGNIIKYNVKISVISLPEEKEELDDEEKEEKEKIKKEKVKKNKEKTEMDQIGLEIKKEMKTVDLFTPEYLQILYNCYLNKANKKPKDTPLKFNNIKVRVYVYRCLNLAAQDNCNDFVDYMAGYSAFCRANAFVEMHLGDNYQSSETKQVKYINDVNSYVKDTLNPSFFKYYELEGDLPSDWKLVVNVRSYSSALNHSLIGSTVIDLEDRYLCDFRNRELLKYKALEQKYNNLINAANSEENDEDDEDKKKLYQNMLNKIDIILTNELKPLQIPVESRPLVNPEKKVAQGMIEMFVEVLTSSEAKMKKPEKIEPPPPEEFELRLVIWETRDIPAMDPKKPKTIYFRVSFDPEGWLSNPIVKETDTHMGVDDGIAIYNWRMKFPIKIPCTFPRLYFTCNAFNTVGSDDTLGECYISLKRVFKKLLQEGKLDIEKKWIPFTHPKDPGDTKGELLITINMVQQFEADQDPVGESWDEPNKNPKLEKPTVGRGVLDFLKGSIFDVSKWDFSFDLFGSFKIMLIIASVVILFVVLFIAPGILVK